MAENNSTYMIEKYNDFLKKNGIPKIKGEKGINSYKGEYIANLITKNYYKNILEIGRAFGYSYGLFRFFSPKSYIVSIDIIEQEKANNTMRVFNDKKCKFITGNSFKVKDLDIIFDLVLIDGDHSYDWAKKDWDNIQNNLSKNAIVIFDDTVIGSEGVNKVFEEIKEEKYRPVQNLGIIKINKYINIINIIKHG